MYLTPVTPGTVSTIVPRPMAAGSTSPPGAALRSTSARTKSGSDQYVSSARCFADIVKKAGADVLISNHTIFDGSKTKLPALATRKAGDPNPYVIGTDSVLRYLKVAEECAQAIKLQLP